MSDDERAADGSGVVPPAPAREVVRSPVLRVRSVPDLLSLVPVVLGFEPAESLVVVGVAGRHPGFQVRVDLPQDARDEEETTALAEQVVAAVLPQGCTRVAVLAFSGRETADLVATVTARRFRHAGVELLDVLRADGRRYWSLLCADERCCSPRGTPYDPRATVLRAEAALAGRSVAPDRSTVAARFAAARGEARTSAHAAVRAAEDEALAVLGLRNRAQLRRPTRQVADSAAPIGAARVDAMLDILLPAGGSDPAAVAAAVTAARAATLSVWCALVPVRDLAWSRMSRADAASHLALWTAVSRWAVPPYEPAVLSLAAFAAWLSGDGASAWCALDRCVEADPAYSMVSLLRETLQRCMSPDLWTPVPREIAWTQCVGPTGDHGARA